MLNKIPPYLRNKYLLVLIGTFIWMMFFDRYKLPSQYKLSAEITKLEKDRDFYRSEIDRISKEKSDLFNKPGELERFAREKYFMKKNNEDLFIIVEEE